MPECPQKDEISRERFEEIIKKIKRESDGFPPQHQQQAAGGGRRGGGTLNTITPCAACKLLRRRCAQECPFSPYFSPHEPHKFASVHKVFGASNVSKMLMEVPENQRADAANSLVYEANVRLQDPVYGCMGAILALQHEVQLLQDELNAVKAQSLKYKYTQTNLLPSSHATLLSPVAISIATSSPPVPPLPPPTLAAFPISSTSCQMYNPVAPGGPDFNNDISTGNNNMTYFG